MAQWKYEVRGMEKKTLFLGRTPRVLRETKLGTLFIFKEKETILGTSQPTPAIKNTLERKVLTILLLRFRQQSRTIF